MQFPQLVAMDAEGIHALFILKITTLLCIPRSYIVKLMNLIAEGWDILKVLVLGGTGVISREIVEQLSLANHDVTVFNRGKRGVELPSNVAQLEGDRHDTQAFSDMMKGHNFDVVMDMICYNVEDAKTTVNTFRGRAKHLIVCSTVAAYQRPFRQLPIREENEELLHHPTFPYGYYKAEMERYLLSSLVPDELPVTIIRPSLTYGIGCANVGVLRQNFGIVDRIRKRKSLVMFGDGTTPWNFTFAKDLAKAFIGSAMNPKTYRKAYHATNSNLHYWEDLYLEFGRVLGIEPNIVHLPTAILKAANPELCSHLDDEKKFPSIFDNSNIQNDVPLFRPQITLYDGIKTLVEWYERDNHVVDSFKDRLEDQLVELYRDSIQMISATSETP